MRDIGKETHVHLIHLLFLFLFLPFPKDSHLLFVKMTSHFRYKITFSIPIFDWGLGKGKVQKAKAAQEVVKAQVQQYENDYRRQMFTAVSQFNNQRQQCMVSERAMRIASERYELTMHRFKEGL